MDLDEIVMVPGRGLLSLGTALREFRAFPPLRPGSIRLTAFFRDVGCEPTIYEIDDIERMASALDEEDDD